MEIQYTKTEFGYECCAFSGNGSELAITLTDEIPSGARMSLGGVFSKPTSKKARFDIAAIENGTHVLYLHDGEKSTKIGTIEFLDGRVKIVENEDDVIYSLRRRLASQTAEIVAIKARIEELETRVYRTVIF